MKLVSTVSTAACRITQVESEHLFVYLTEQRVVCLNAHTGKRMTAWALVHAQVVMKPEWLAQATQVQGAAVAAAQASIQAAQAQPCDECSGKPLADGPPCWKCNGTGRKP